MSDEPWRAVDPERYDELLAKEAALDAMTARAAALTEALGPILAYFDAYADLGPDVAFMVNGTEVVTRADLERLRRALAADTPAAGPGEG